MPHISYCIPPLKDLLMNESGSKPAAAAKSSLGGPRTKSTSQMGRMPYSKHLASALFVLSLLCTFSDARTQNNSGKSPPAALQAWAATLQDMHGRYHALHATAEQEQNPVRARELRAEASEVESAYASHFLNAKTRPEDSALKQMLVEAVVTGFDEHNLGRGLIDLPLAVALCKPVWSGINDAGVSSLYISAYSEPAEIPLPKETLWSTEPNPNTIVVPESALGAGRFADLKAESSRPQKNGTRLYMSLFVTSVEVSPIRSAYFSVRLTGLYPGVFMDRADATASLKPMKRVSLEESYNALREQMLEDVHRADATFATEIVENLAVFGHEFAGTSPLQRMANPIPRSRRPYVLTASETTTPDSSGGLTSEETSAVHGWFDQTIITPLSKVSYVMDGTTPAMPLGPNVVSVGNLPKARTKATVMQMPAEGELLNRNLQLRDATWTAPISVSGLASLADPGGYFQTIAAFDPVAPPTAEMRSVQFTTMRQPPEGTVFTMRRFGDRTIAVGAFKHQGRDVHFLASEGTSGPWQPMDTSVTLGQVTQEAWLHEYAGVPYVTSTQMTSDDTDVPFWAARLVNDTWRPVPLDALDFAVLSVRPQGQQIPASLNPASIKPPTEVSDAEYKAMSNKDKRRVLRERADYNRAIREIGEQQRRIDAMQLQLRRAVSSMFVKGSVCTEDGVYVVASPPVSSFSNIKGSFVFRWANNRWTLIGNDIKGIATELSPGQRTFVLAQGAMMSQGPWVCELVGDTWVDRRAGIPQGAAVHALVHAGDEVLALAKTGVMKLTNETWQKADLSGNYSILEIEGADVLPSGRVFGRGKLVHTTTGRPFNGLFELDRNRVIPVTEEATYGPYSNLPRLTRSVVVAEIADAILLTERNKRAQAVNVASELIPVPIGEVRTPTQFTIVDRRHARSDDVLRTRKAELMDGLREKATQLAWSLVRQ